MWGVGHAARGVAVDADRIRIRIESTGRELEDRARQGRIGFWNDLRQCQVAMKGKDLPQAPEMVADPATEWDEVSQPLDISCGIWFSKHSKSHTWFPPFAKAFGHDGLASCLKRPGPLPAEDEGLDKHPALVLVDLEEHATEILDDVGHDK